MTRQRSTLRRFWGRAALGLAVACSTLTLLAPVAVADPQSDAAAAIDAAWSAAGGEQSVLGTRDGDVYTAGAGFGQNFSGGAIFFTPETGARVMYGEILAKYRALGGPAQSDLGFPTIDEGPGRVSAESRNSTFNAADQPVIFWTPESGAWVVRGAINAAWDALGGSAGTLGVPTADQTRAGDVVSQTFSGGQIAFDTTTRQFTTEPADLAQQLGNLTIPGEAPTPPPAETPPPAPSETAVVAPTAPAVPHADTSGGFRWHTWWLWWIVPLAVLLLGSLVAWLVGRRRRAAAVAVHEPTPESSTFEFNAAEPPRWVPSAGEHADDADHWFSDVPPAQRNDTDAAPFGTPRYGFPRFDDLPDDEPVAGDVERTTAFREVASAAPEFELFSQRGAHAVADDQDAVDTAPTPVQSESRAGDALPGRHAALDIERPTFEATGLRDDEYEGYEYEGYDYEGDEGYLEPPVAGSVTDEEESDIVYAEEVDHDAARAVVIAEEVPSTGEPVASTGDEDSGEPDDDDTLAPPALHLPLDDPHLAPKGYPVKGRMSTGTYHTPGTAGYDHVVAEIWFADAAHAEANGFVRGD